MRQRSFGSEISKKRGLGNELSTESRAAIISKWEEGALKKELAAEFRVHRNTITNTITRWQKHHQLESLPRSGRPEVLSRREKRLLFRIARKLPKIEYDKLVEEAGLHALTKASTLRTTTPHHNTIAKALKLQGLSNYRCKLQPKLTRSAALHRMRFSKAYRHFNWGRRVVKFSDECSVQRGSGRQAEWCFRYPEEVFDPAMITEKEKPRRMSQMVWAMIWLSPNGRVGRSKLVIMERDFKSKKHGYSGDSYIETLEEGLRPTYLPGHIFMQDNAPIHTCNAVKEWLESHGIHTLEWPPYSPDLNPIEHLWWTLKKYVNKLHPELRNMGNSEEDWDALKSALVEGWKAIPNSLIRSLIQSMPRRLAAVRKAKGWQTKY